MKFNYKKVLVLSIIVLPAISELATAQGGGGGRGRSFRCHGEKVTRVDVHAYAPFDSGNVPIVSWLTRTATRLHSVTKEKVITRFLALHVGEPCTELRRSESERILRAQPYLADADVQTYSDGNGGVIVDVVVIDEISLVLGAQVSSTSPHARSLKLGEANLKGQAVYLAGEWRSGGFYRDGYGLQFKHYQLFGRPYQLNTLFKRNSIGGEWDVEANHAFLTDIQRRSWRVTAGNSDKPMEFLRPDYSFRPALNVIRTYGDIGGVIRIGPPKRVGLFGGSISHERSVVDQMPVAITSNGIVPDTSTALFNRYSNHRSTRLNLLWGFRNVEFIRVTGFDALDGQQDIRKGFQISSLLGRGIKGFASEGNDLFASTNLYLGLGSRRSFAALETHLEGRRDLKLNGWDGVVFDGMAAWYTKPFPKHSFRASLEGSAGSKQRIPFQLTLSDLEGGVRGYSGSDVGGGRRYVMRLEDHYYWGRVRNIASVGLGGFFDAGKLYAGDVPFGQTTGVKSSVGFSLLAALPPRSQRLWRVDFAVPLNKDSGNRWEIRASNRDLTQIFRREPADVREARERSVPTSVFNWP